MTEPTSLSSQISLLIDISRQTLEEVRKLEERLQDVVSNTEKHKCLTIEEFLSFFPIRQRLPQSIKLPQPETKS